MVNQKNRMDKSSENMLEWIIAPVTADAFTSRYWESESLVVPREQPDYFIKLFSTSVIDNLISSTQLRYPSFRMVKDGEVIPVNKYTRAVQQGGSVNNIMDRDSVFHLHNTGATLVLQSLQNIWQPITAFADGLAQVMSHPVNVNAYLTPKTSQGFHAHFDTHDVFVLQIEGRKLWRIYDQPVTYPLSEGVESGGFGDRKCILEFVLNPGEAVYLPRGVYHDAKTVDQYSLHLTVGTMQIVYQAAIKRLVSDIIESLTQDDLFRKALPLGFWDSDEIDYSEADELIAQTIQRLESNLTSKRLFEHEQKRFFKLQHGPYDGRLLDLYDAQNLSSETTVWRRKNVIFQIDTRSDQIMLEFNRKQLTFPTEVKPILDYVTQSREFTTNELPTDMSKLQKLIVVQRLITEGFLTLQHEDS